MVRPVANQAAESSPGVVRGQSFAAGLEAESTRPKRIRSDKQRVAGSAAKRALKLCKCNGTRRRARPGRRTSPVLS